MRRTAVVGVPICVGVLVVLARRAKLHDRVMAHCEAMFERLPDTFPPKRMMRGVEEIRVKTARILELLEAENNETDRRLSPAP